MLAGQRGRAAAAVAGLHLVATPIGNLRDITLRALETLAGADLIACEDTRVTRKLLDHYGIATPLTPYHEHNAAAARPKLLARLAAGQAVALVSDAGTPLISDPGFKLVRAAQEAGPCRHRGAGPVGRAGGADGRRPADRPVLLRGVPAAKDGQRQEPHRRTRAHPGDAGPVRERAAPRRVRWPISRTALATAQAAVCRELTKLHEEVRRGSLPELARDLCGRRRDPRRVRHRDRAAVRRRSAARAQSDIDALLRRALERGSVKDAVSEVAAATGRPRREVYQRALALSRGGRTMARRQLHRRAGRAASRTRRGVPDRAVGGEPRRRLSDRQGLPHRGAALPHARSARSTSWPAPQTTLVFVEVKARDALDDAAEAVTQRQQRRIVAAAAAWLPRHPDDVERDIRFDVVLVAPGRLPRHIPAAFDAE